MVSRSTAASAPASRRTPPARPRSARGEATRERIVEVAARALRQRGYAGVGVADVMHEAGLTHGGFYAHFESRDALLVAALERAGRETAATLANSLDAGRARGASPFRALVETYLADRLLSHTEQGCVVAAVCSEMTRQSPEVVAPSAERVRRLIASVASLLPPGVAPAQAPVIAATMAGALQFARALGANAQGRALLATSREALLSQYDRAPDDIVRRAGDRGVGEPVRAPDRAPERRRD